jgi:hypothetical protein
MCLGFNFQQQQAAEAHSRTRKNCTTPCHKYRAGYDRIYVSYTTVSVMTFLPKIAHVHGIYCFGLPYIIKIEAHLVLEGVQAERQ